MAQYTEDFKVGRVTVIKGSDGKYGIITQNSNRTPKCEYDSISLLYGDTSKRYLRTRQDNTLGAFDSQLERFVFKGTAKDIKISERKNILLIKIPRKIFGIIPIWSKILRVSL